MSKVTPNGLEVMSYDKPSVDLRQWVIMTPSGLELMCDDETPVDQSKGWWQIPSEIKVMTSPSGLKVTANQTAWT